MLKTIRFTVLPTIWVNVKALRMNFMQYFMLVVIFPLSYLVINNSGGATNQLSNVVGMFISMLMSLFINMQSTLVASSNNVTIIETYSVYQVKPLKIFFSQSLFHFTMSMVIFVISEIILIFHGVSPQIIRILLWIVLAFLFLHAVSVALGSILRNPNMAGPIINLLYMILVMVTPLYHSIGNMSVATKIAYSFNPFSHIISLLYWANGLESLCAWWVSALILIGVSLYFDVLVYKRWNDVQAVEKITLF